MAKFNITKAVLNSAVNAINALAYHFILEATRKKFYSIGPAKTQKS
jgi:hypothetical protein